MSGSLLRKLTKEEPASDKPSGAFRPGVDQAFGPTTYAQCGEDLYLANVFRLIGTEGPSYLDVGGHHPWNGSNTAMLYLSGSSGIVIEPNFEIVEQFRSERPRDLVVNIGAGARAGKLPFYRIGWDSGRNSFSKPTIDATLSEFPTSWVSDANEVDVLTINQIVEQYCNGVFPDLLSIDVEGFDLDVLTAANFETTKPKVICVEVRTGYNTDSPDEIAALLKSRNFVPYARTWGNGIFVAKEYSEKLRL